MTDVDALVAFIPACTAEERRIAEKAAKFKYDHPSDAQWEGARFKVEKFGGTTEDRFNARFTPARVLAQCDATEKILDWRDSRRRAQ